MLNYNVEWKIVGLGLEDKITSQENKADFVNVTGSTLMKTLKNNNNGSIQNKIKILKKKIEDKPDCPP